MSGTPMTWDSPVKNDGTGAGVVLPEDSIATFVVQKLEKGVSDKKKSPMAILHLKLTNEHGTTTCLEHLVLHSESEWKICEFFRANGQRKHGEEFTPNWNAIEGTSGKCIVGVRHFAKKSDKPGEKTGTANEVKSFLDPDDTAPTPAPAKSAYKF